MSTGFVRRSSAALVIAALALMFCGTVSAADEKEDKDNKELAAKLVGTWKWSFTGQNGQTFESTLKLKNEDGKITGAVTGRNGNETEIEDAKLEKSTLSFAVSRERNGQKMTTKYSGKVEDDKIKGTSERTGRDGQTRSSEWEAKRETEKDAAAK